VTRTIEARNAKNALIHGALRRNVSTNNLYNSLIHGFSARVNFASKKPATLCANVDVVCASRRSRSTSEDIVFASLARNEMQNAPPSSTSRASSSPWRMMTSREPLRTARASGRYRRTPATIASAHSGNAIARPGGGTSLRIAPDSPQPAHALRQAGFADFADTQFIRPAYYKTRPGALFERGTRSGLGAPPVGSRPFTVPEGSTRREGLRCAPIALRRDYALCTAR